MDLGIEGLGPAEHIGRGGFADVYRAEQLSLRRPVAVKVLRSQASDPEVDARFQRECHAIGKVSNHPHIIAVHHGGLTSNGRAYLVMEYLPGGSLADRVREQGPMPVREVVDATAKIARALAVAHRAGVLHRDVKPANIMISAYGEPALGDFGIARIEGGHQTVTGQVTASIVHAAPEVLEGRRPTPAADIYSLGSTLFELAVGHAPYYNPSDESMWPVMKRILSEPMPSPESVGFSPALGVVFRRATARDPNDRYHDADEMAGALTALLDDPAALDRAAPAPGPPISDATTVLPPDPNRTILSSEPLVPAMVEPVAVPSPGGAPAPGGHRPAGPVSPVPAFEAWPGPDRSIDLVPVLAAAVVAIAMVASAVWGLLLPVLDSSVRSSTDPGSDGPALTLVDQPEEGVLRVGSAYRLELAMAAPGTSYRLVVDGEPHGEAGVEVPDLIARPGRHRVQVDITTSAGVERSAPLDVVALSAPEPGFRAHLARVPAVDQNLPALVEFMDILTAQGHEGLDLLSTDELAGVADGNWLVTVGGFDDGSAAEAYCRSSELIEPERCYVARVEPADA